MMKKVIGGIVKIVYLFICFLIGFGSGLATQMLVLGPVYRTYQKIMTKLGLED